MLSRIFGNATRLAKPATRTTLSHTPITSFAQKSLFSSDTNCYIKIGHKLYDLAVNCSDPTLKYTALKELHQRKMTIAFGMLENNPHKQLAILGMIKHTANTFGCPELKKTWKTMHESAEKNISTLLKIADGYKTNPHDAVLLSLAKELSAPQIKLSYFLATTEQKTKIYGSLEQIHKVYNIHDWGNFLDAFDEIKKELAVRPPQKI